MNFFLIHLCQTRFCLFYLFGMFKKAGVRLTPYQPSGRKMELEL